MPLSIIRDFNFIIITLVKAYRLTWRTLCKDLTTFREQGIKASTWIIDGNTAKSGN